MTAGQLTIENSTFEGNRALGGGGSGLSGNGGPPAFLGLGGGGGGGGAAGGIEVYATSFASFDLANTIIFGNGANECVTDGTPASLLSSSGAGNLIGNNFNCQGVVTSAAPGLGPLQNNLGMTPTLSISESSPAFNAGDPGASLATDQRGEPRPSMGGFDIGAFELCIQHFGPVIQVCPFPPVIAETELLTIQVSPAGGGTTNPGAGTSSYTLNTVVSRQATPNPGFSFLNWTGNMTDPNSASTTVVMTTPQTVTANFVAGNTLLGGNILTKSGPLNARVWPVNIANASSSPVTAHNAQINSLTLTQVAGAAYTPVRQTALPASVGDLAPGSSATVNLTIDS